MRSRPFPTKTGAGRCSSAGARSDASFARITRSRAQSAVRRSRPKSLRTSLYSSRRWARTTSTSSRPTTSPISSPRRSATASPRSPSCTTRAGTAAWRRWSKSRPMSISGCPTANSSRPILPRATRGGVTTSITPPAPLPIWRKSRSYGGRTENCSPASSCATSFCLHAPRTACACWTF